MFDILFLEEIFLNEYLETLNELCMISDNFKPIIKFPRGRPLKYITEKEKKLILEISREHQGWER